MKIERKILTQMEKECKNFITKGNEKYSSLMKRQCQNSIVMKC